VEGFVEAVVTVELEKSTEIKFIFQIYYIVLGSTNTSSIFHYVFENINYAL